MSTQKILDFGGAGPSLTFRFLQFLAAKKNAPWTFERHEEFNFELLQGAQAALVTPHMSSEILSKFQVVPTQVRAIELMDSLFFEQGAWLPRILIHEGLRRVLITEARDLDIRSPAFVVGDEELLRVAAAVLAEMGFAEIFLVGDVAKLAEQKRILSRSQLGITFHTLAVEELTMQATSAGIVVNTSDLSQSKALLTDLSYFNFMKQNGFAVDLSSAHVPNALLEEAERAELRTLPYANIMKTVVKLWLERLQSSDLITDDELVQCWMDFLRENPSSV